MAGVIIEIWKDVDGYKDIYQVSNLGRVKSLKFNRETFLKPRKCKDGYLQVNFMKKMFLIHRLVLKTFSYNSTLEVDHIDSNKQNNCLDNLRYCSRRENTSFYFNSKKSKTSSKYLGVSWSKERKKWIAKIKVNNKTEYIGGFILEEEASKAYINFRDSII